MLRWPYTHAFASSWRIPFAAQTRYSLALHRRKVRYALAWTRWHDALLWQLDHLQDRED